MPKMWIASFSLIAQSLVYSAKGRSTCLGTLLRKFFSATPNVIRLSFKNTAILILQPPKDNVVFLKYFEIEYFHVAIPLPRQCFGLDSSIAGGCRKWWKSAWGYQVGKEKTILNFNFVFETCPKKLYLVSFLGGHTYSGFWSCFCALCRKIENKLLACKVELRPFSLNLDLSDIHGNRELPAAYPCFLGVADSALPLKGTAHRTVRGAPVPDSTTNVFLGCLICVTCFWGLPFELLDLYTLWFCFVSALL